MNFKTIFLSVALYISLPVVVSQAVPAFIGAEGFGANSIGGRGGQIIKVKNLNDSGPDSFRAAVLAAGPRIIIFEVSGIINLFTEILIKEPYLTIAGESSPGGVLITGRQTSINTHNVIIRYMRFRVGSHGTLYPGGDPNTHDAIDLFGNAMPSWFDGPGVSDVILDHCSISWGVDECITAGTGAHDFTVQWCIISEGLLNAGHDKADHSKGMALSLKYGGVNNASIHHNYFANNADRNPYVSGPANGYSPGEQWVDIRNNVVYNCNQQMIVQENGAGNWIHNYIRRDGPATTNSDYANEICFWNPAPDADNLIYVEGNLGGRRTSQSDPEWCVGNEWHEELATTDYQKDTPYDISNAPVTTQVMSREIADSIVAKAGATVPVRDSVDIRLMNEWATGTGAIRENVDYPDDFPVFSNPSPPADIDNDGMADSWEIEKNLNTGINDSANKDLDNDYTNIEVYLHELAGSISSGIKKEDLNNDNCVDIKDLVICINVINEKESNDKADVNSDGMFDSKDTELIINFILNL